MPAETNRERVTERFPGDVAKHELVVQLDQGVYRHLTCREPGTSVHAFNVTTWPGYLAITGDMGAFVFSRLHDMFEFFGMDEGRVSLSYWAEKLVATGKYGGGEKEFSPDLFRRTVRERFAEWLREHRHDFTYRELREVRDEFHDTVLPAADEGEHEARRAVNNLSFGRREVISDFWDYSLTEYTYHFVWCCHAIVWAIRQYRTFKAAT